jgi:hypothetical protein
MSPEEVKRQLHEQAKSSRDETVAMYERWAAEERQAGRISRAVRYEERANRVRSEPLPNAA